MDEFSELTEVDIKQAILSVIKNEDANKHTALPAKVVKYNNSEQKVSVQPILQEKYSGDEEAQDLAIIDDVPVCFPSSKEMIIHFPLEVGDTGMIICCSRSINDWLAHPTGETTILPDESDQFDLNDCFFCPGIKTFKSSFKGNFKKNTLDIQVKPGKKISIGNGNIDIVSMLYELIVNLQQPVDTPGAGSTGSLTNILPLLQEMQTKLEPIVNIETT